MKFLFSTNKTEQDKANINLKKLPELQFHTREGSLCGPGNMNQWEVFLEMASWAECALWLWLLWRLMWETLWPSSVR